MQYRAIVACRNCRDNIGRSTKNTTLFDHEGTYPPTIKSAQEALDEMVELTCDKCGENDWRVVEVQQVNSRGN